MSRVATSVSRNISPALQQRCPFQQPTGNAQKVTTDAVYQPFMNDFVRDAKSTCSIPGPKGLPLIGTLYNYIKKNGFKFNKLFEAHAHQFDKYGPFFRETIVGRTFNVLRDPREWKLKVIQQEPKCPRRVTLEPMVKYRKMRKLSQGLVNSQGEEWLRFRSTFDKKLMVPKEIERHFAPLSEVADDFVSHLQRVANPETKTVVNIGNDVFKWSLESICVVLFGTRLGCFQSPPSESSLSFISNCRKFFTNMQQLMYEPPYRKWVSSKTWDEYVQCSDALLQHGIDMVKTVPEDSLAAHFLQNTNLKPDEVVQTLLDLIIGAMETTTKTMIWNLYCLAKHQDAQERIYQEVKTKLDGKPMTLEDLRNLPLVKASLKETLRLYPAPFVISRIMQNDTNVRGFNVPAGEEVVISLWAIGRDEALFPQSEKFVPERWTSKNLTEQQKMYLSLPFGHGRRMCIGRRIAELEIYILLTKLLRSCRLGDANEAPVEPIIEMTLAQDRPVNLNLFTR